MNKTKSKKKLPVIISVLLVIIIAADWIASTILYNSNFKTRFESYKPLMYRVEDYEGLSMTKYQFTSDKGQKLRGYWYSAGSNQKGIVIMAHGFGGGGHNFYMSCANQFAQNGYYVFAYDVTGCDESEGDGVRGIPQGMIDLQHAISFVEENKDFPKLPIVLFGHSWGGYSVCSVLKYHPEVKAVVACSGFNSSTDMIEDVGTDIAGPLFYGMLPFVKLHEKILFKEYSSCTAMDGFAASNAAVMVVHSDDDTVVPKKYGYDIYYETYKDDSRFKFLEFKDKGHNNIFRDTTYYNAFDKEILDYYTTLDYDYNSPANSERFAKDRADYINNHIDRAKWADCVDKDLLKQFIDFYDSHLN